MKGYRGEDEKEELNFDGSFNVCIGTYRLSS